MKKNIKNTSSLFKTISYILMLIVVILFITLITLLVKDSSSNTEEINANPIVVMQTSMGIIKIELNKTAAPITVANFISYVNESFYDGLIFHRVIPGFMVQGGGFDSNGVKKNTKSPIIIESNNSLKNTIGTIAMARTMDPNSATSQFFINVADNAFLDYTGESNPGYTVFGKIIEGLDVIQNIEKVETTTKDAYANWPVESVILTKVYLE